MEVKLISWSRLVDLAFQSKILLLEQLITAQKSQCGFGGFTDKSLM